MLLLVVAVCLAVYATVILLNRGRIANWLLPAVPPEVEMPTPDPDDLLSAIKLLSQRVTLAEAFNKSLRRIVSVLTPILAVLIPVVLAVGVMIVVERSDAADAQKTADRVEGTVGDIVAVRDDSRVGICLALNKIYMKHNHYVQTTINERQAILEVATDPSTIQFLKDQIANYQSDLVTTFDCTVKAQVDSIFTADGPPSTQPGG